MECRAYGICLDSQSRGYLGKDRKVSSAAGGNLSRMHKTEETAKESRLNFMYSHLRNRTLACTRSQRRASATNWFTSLSERGLRTISFTITPAWRIESSVSLSGCERPTSLSR